MGELGIQGHPWLHNKLKTKQGYGEPISNNQTKLLSEERGAELCKGLWTLAGWATVLPWSGLSVTSPLP